MQGLLRHSSIKITMDVYDQAVSEEKQKAHRDVIRQVTRSGFRSAPRLLPPQRLICWRPRWDLNPCYRRERALICCITL